MVPQVAPPSLLFASYWQHCGGPASYLLGTCYLLDDLRNTHTPSKYLRATYSHIYMCYVSTSYFIHIYIYIYINIHIYIYYILYIIYYTVYTCIYGPAFQPHRQYHTPTTPVLWLTHDHGPGGLERWTIYSHIFAKQASEFIHGKLTQE